MNKIAIIGGGITGITTAIHLSKKYNNATIDIYERKKNILSGGPYCHLHAGGFLYPDISIIDSQILLEQSLLFASYFKNAMIKRPTIITYHKNYKESPKKLLYKCILLKHQYTIWTKKYNTFPLGPCDHFFAVYHLEDMLYFKTYGHLPVTDEINKMYHNPYVETFCKLLDNVNDIQYPFISVCEFGIDQEKVVQQLTSELNICSNIRVHTDTYIQKEDITFKSDNTFTILNNHYDYFINASGAYSRDIVSSKQTEHIEVKSSWLIKNESISQDFFPEIAIIGERNTKNGMLQITPMDLNKFQLHYMSPDSTIISKIEKKDDTLPIIMEFPQDIQTILNNDSLSTSCIFKKTQVAIDYLQLFFPQFKKETYVLDHTNFWGIQRIPFTLDKKRTSSIMIKHNYIELHVVKAISTIDVAQQVCFLCHYHNIF